MTTPTGTQVKNTLPVIRICGKSRIPGAMYARCEPQEYGSPIDSFMFCPTIPMDIFNMGLSAQGVVVAQWGEHWHIFDVVGLEYEVADFVAEAMTYGSSRLIPKTTANLDKLDEHSRHIFISRHAYLVDPTPAYLNRAPVGRFPHGCPLDHTHEVDPDIGVSYTCPGLLWEVLPAREGDIVQKDSRLYRRRHPAGFYHDVAMPHEGYSPEYDGYAAFMWLPISRFEVVQDTEQNTHEKALELLQGKLNLPYACTDH